MKNLYSTLSMIAGWLGVLILLWSFAAGPDAKLFGVNGAQGLQYIMVYFLAAIWFAHMAK